MKQMSVPYMYHNIFDHHLFQHTLFQHCLFQQIDFTDGHQIYRAGGPLMLEQVVRVDSEAVPPRTTREEAAHLAATVAVTRWIRSPLMYLSPDSDSADDTSEDNNDASDNDDDEDLTQVRVGDVPVLG